MTVTVSAPIPLRSRSPQGSATDLLWVRVRQEDSAPDETWEVTGLPMACTLVGYRTRQENVTSDVTLRPTLGIVSGFAFGNDNGSGLARYRRRADTIQASGQVPLWLPTGSLFGRSGLSTTLTGNNNALITDLLFTPEAPITWAAGSEGRWGEWEITDLSTRPIQVASGLTLGTTLQATDPILVNGAVQIETWIDFTSAAGSADPSDLRIRWEMRRSVGSGPWAPVLFEDVANASAASGVITVPSYIYEVSDTSWADRTPVSYPARAHYIIPARNWSGEVRALVGDDSGTIDGADAAVFMYARSG